jgi:heptosyltransferase I
MITAPHGGYASGAEYYERSSSGPHVAAIRHPTLIVAALDDPLIPGESVSRWPLPASGVVVREMLPTGGHVGFAAPTSAPGRFWAAERAMADAVLAACTHAPLDFTGKDTLKRALAMFGRAHLLLTPDSGPMHMANAAGTAVLGLHAASNPDRSGPYSDRRWCVNRYDEAARSFLGKPASELPWGTKIERPGVMDLITVDDVIERFEAAASHLGFA